MEGLVEGLVASCSAALSLRVVSLREIAGQLAERCFRAHLEKNGDPCKDRVKLQRVCGGCLGAKRRRRTWGSCEKLGRAANQARTPRSPNGTTQRGSCPVIPC